MFLSQEWNTLKMRTVDSKIMAMLFNYVFHFISVIILGKNWICNKIIWFCALVSVYCHLFSPECKFLEICTIFERIRHKASDILKTVTLKIDLHIVFL